MADDLDDMLKSLRGSRSAPAAPTPAVPSAEPAGPKKDEPGGIGWHLGNIAKGAASEATDLAGLLPGQVGDAATQLGQKVGASEDEGWVEWGERGVGRALPYLLTPEIGFGARLGSIAARAFPRMVPATAERLAAATAKGAKPVVRGNPATGFTMQNPSRLANLARRAAPAVGQVAERSAVGAGIGAAHDPEHPGVGAAAGALGSAIPSSLGALVRSKGGQHVAGHALRHMAGAAIAAPLHHALGPIGYAAYPMFAWSSGPGGKAINSVTHAIMDKSGHIVGYLPDRVARALTAGISAGAAEGAKSVGE